mmetsp:Transcript_2345/g.4432  ORF Transcript_2345/g.4432 Transcript_2345/m.4432 type:complete len:108 (+) Transcript_2345:476-799(+)
MGLHAPDVTCAHGPVPSTGSVLAHKGPGKRCQCDSVTSLSIKIDPCIAQSGEACRQCLLGQFHGPRCLVDGAILFLLQSVLLAAALDGRCMLLAVVRVIGILFASCC